jgi:hypothetical protein
MNRLGRHSRWDHRTRTNRDLRALVPWIASTHRDEYEHVRQVRPPAEAREHALPTVESPPLDPDSVQAAPEHLPLQFDHLLDEFYVVQLLDELKNLLGRVKCSHASSPPRIGSADLVPSPPNLCDCLATILLPSSPRPQGPAARHRSVRPVPDRPQSSAQCRFRCYRFATGSGGKGGETVANASTRETGSASVYFRATPLLRCGDVTSAACAANCPVTFGDRCSTT